MPGATGCTPASMLRRWPAVRAALTENNPALLERRLQGGVAARRAVRVEEHGHVSSGQGRGHRGRIGVIEPPDGLFEAERLETLAEGLVARAFPITVTVAPDGDGFRVVSVGKG